MSNRHCYQKGGELAHPGDRKDHNYKCENMSDPTCAMGALPMWSDGRRLPKMDGMDVLQDLILDVGQLVLPQIPV